MRPLTVEAHLGLVHVEARRYRWALRGGALELKDLAQAGALGLMRALELYDPTRGTQFSTYARPWIKHAIDRCIATTGSSVRVPCYRWAAGERPQTTASLDAPRGDDASYTLHDRLASHVPDPLELAHEAERAKVARRALDCLDERERLVVESCTMGDEPLAGVARRIPNRRGGCISRERARQIQECALSRMRKEIRQLAAE